ncbi:lysophosphatidic acid receptor 6-like [Indicator indicator]|uniref:lysophosphatidic acid receptor 6-like n=1 Tax=Indicator indicator TaxID=1002788 RepID=UPI0023E01477|nr:lysophosphatidic acid receptor 6-like [Indicator indicator]
MADISWTEGVSTVANGSSEPPLEADFQYSLFPAIYSIVFVLGLLENIPALYLLSCQVKHSSHSSLYMTNLALVDTLFICVLPFKIHYHLNWNDWIFGDMACRVTGTLYYINIYLSIAFFTCICLDRYVAVLHPFTYLQIKAIHYLLVVTALWLLALSVTVPLILEGPLHNSGVRNTTACFENFPVSSWTGRMAPYNVLALVFGFLVPFSIILVSYPLIARKISQIKHSTRKRKALRTIYTILGICTLCFVPYHLTHLLHFLVRVQLIQNQAFTNLIYKMRRVTLALVSFNCCLNPLLYYFSSSSKPWLFNFRLCFRSKMVYTICDQNLGEASCAYKLQQIDGNKPPGDGIV